VLIQFRLRIDLMVGEELDAILMPGYQAPAPRHDTYGLPIYTVLQNLLNYPAGILPCGAANMDLDKAFMKDGVKWEPACKF